MAYAHTVGAIRRDELRRQEAELRRAAEAARLVSPLRRPRRRRAA
ncbi:MAG TPA: hypothetical protein VF235_03695 [Actinomycetota bacterium]